jgi:pSer/pThr/pTyr-binding forkhead associated (FHA) protein
MQLKPGNRVLTVMILWAGMLGIMSITTPVLQVYGRAQTRLPGKSRIGDSYIHSSFSMRQTVITTTSTVTVPTLETTTEDPDIAPQSTPEPTNTEITSQSSADGEETTRGFATNLLGFLQSKPLVSGGIILVTFISILTFLVITTQHKIKSKSKPQTDEKSTAPLMSKVTPIDKRAYLQLKDNPDITFSLAVDDVRIGRSPDNTIVITPEIEAAETVSRYHARLYRVDKWILEDLNSTNGIYVNGQRTGRNYLKNGWEIGIGGVTFIFQTGHVEV